MHGLRTKLVQLSNNIIQLPVKPFIIIITETWLHDEILNTELNLMNYVIHRCDRKQRKQRIHSNTSLFQHDQQQQQQLQFYNQQAQQQQQPSTSSSSVNQNIPLPKKKGGGSLIAVHKTLTSKLLSKIDNDQESLFVQIKFKHSTLVVGCSYITKPATLAAYQNNAQHIEYLFSKYPDNHFALFGDYNLHHTNWNASSPISHTHSRYVEPIVQDAADSLNNMASILNLKQLFPDHPTKNYTLDLCFSQDTYFSVSTWNGLLELLPSDSHHIPVVFDYTDVPDSKLNNSEKFYLYKLIDINTFSLHFSKFISALDQISINSPLIDLEFIFDKFYSSIHDAIQKSVPVRIHKANEFPSWYDDELIALIRNKKEIHLRWKILSDHNDLIGFKQLRALCRQKTRRLYNSYLRQIQDNIKTNIKNYWSYVNHQRTDRSIPTKMFLGSNESLNLNDTSNLFGDYFSSVHKLSNYYQVSHLLTNSPDNIEYWILSESEVSDAIHEADCGSASVPDALPMLILKNVQLHWYPSFVNYLIYAFAMVFIPRYGRWLM